MFVRLLLAIALALLGAACAGRSNRDAAARPANIVVEVVNENFYDARVHLVQGGGQRRTLGTIKGNGGHTRTTLGWEPRALVFEVSFIIEGSVYASQPVDLSPGESFELRLPANIDQSGFFRRISRP